MQSSHPSPNPFFLLTSRLKKLFEPQRIFISAASSFGTCNRHSCLLAAFGFFNRVDWGSLGEIESSEQLNFGGNDWVTWQDAEEGVVATKIHPRSKSNPLLYDQFFRGGRHPAPHRVPRCTAQRWWRKLPDTHHPELLFSTGLSGRVPCSPEVGGKASSSKRHHLGDASHLLKLQPYGPSPRGCCSADLYLIDFDSDHSADHSACVMLKLAHIFCGCDVVFGVSHDGISPP